MVLVFIGRYAAVLPGQFSAQSGAQLVTTSLSANKERCIQFAYNMNDELNAGDGTLLVSLNVQPSVTMPLVLLL